MKILNAVLLILLFLSKLLVAQAKVTDIIKPVTLVAGKEKQLNVGDLFYSDKYKLDFFENKNVVVSKINEDSVSFTANSDFEGMSVISFKSDMNTYSIPVISQKEKFYKFSFKPEKHYNEIFLFGSFNGWNRHDIKMTDKDNDEIFEAEVALEPGVYQYKFFGDGKEIVDENNPEKVPNGFGDYNSIRTIADDQNGKLFLHGLNYSANSDYINYNYFIEGLPEKTTIKSGEVFAFLNNSLIEKSKIKVTDNLFSVSLQKDELKGRINFRVAVSINGKVSNFREQLMINGKPISNENFSWYDGIIYSLLIDRFYDGDRKINSLIQHDSLHAKANYFGGDFQGITEKIDNNYFDSLGINTLWISPVYDNPEEAYKEYPAPQRYYSGYHGYWPISSTEVEGRFGIMETFKELIQKAHKHGIKVLLDFVSNHVHKEHPFFKNHRDWFGQLELQNGKLNLRLWDEYRLTTWFEPYLPSFDYEGSKDALETMTDNAVWWLQETGADGFRHDAVKHVPNIFWRTLTKKLKEKIELTRNIEVYQIGETFGSYDLISSYVNNGQLSSQFNFNLYDVALPTFINEKSSFDVLDKEMHKTFSVYGSLHLMGNIMDSHDKNRFMSFADGDLDASQWSAAEVGWSNPPEVDNPENYRKLILYMAYMNSIPGLPVIYYGSEFGMSGASDPDNRRMMRFGNDLSKYEKQTLAEVKKIINIRKSHSALRYGDFYTLRADTSCYAFIRSDFNERIMVVINKSNNKKKVDFKLPQEYQIDEAISLLGNNAKKTSNGKIEFVIPAKSYNYYLLK